MTLTCSFCQRHVDRADCHRNRYGEMICHDCKRTGVNFTWRRRLWVTYKKIPLYVGICLAISAAMLLFAWIVYLISSSGLPRFFY